MKLRKIPLTKRGVYESKKFTLKQQDNSFEWNEQFAKLFVYDVEQKMGKEDPNTLEIIKPLLQTFLKIVKENENGKK